MLLRVVPPRILIVPGLGCFATRDQGVCVRVAWFFFCGGWRPHEERTTTVVDEGKKKDKQPSATKPYVRAFPTRQLCPCYCALRPTTTCLMNHVRFVAPFCFVCWVRGRIHRIQILRGVLGSSSRCRTTQSYYVVVALSQMMFEY